MPESAPADTAPEQPRVFLLSLAQTSWFDEMYERLIDKLSVHARLQRASKPAGAIKYLSSNTPTAILVTNPGLTEAKHSAILDKVLSYVRGGGTVIFCCQFSSFITPDDFDRFFRTKLDLPWEFGDYHRTTVYLNLRVRQINKLHLHGAYSQKAVHLKNVEPTAALYLPSRDSMTESHVFPAAPVDREQTPVAFTAFDQGWVGYVGDVNTEEGSDEVILAMCGL